MKRENFKHPLHTFETAAHLVEAIYRPSSLPEFAGNPLVEALPAYYDGSEALTSLANYPHFADEERWMPQSYRLHAVSRLRTFLKPLPWHLSVAGDIFRHVWQGYRDRNPLANRQEMLEQKYSQAMESRTVLPLQEHVPSHSSTFGLLGASGIGKSTVVDRALKCLPQVIIHKKHGIAQLVWIKVECPPDGSLKQLMYWILEQVDVVMGSNYRSYIRERSPLDDRMALVGQVLEKHFTGLLVIDEIQNVLTDVKRHYRNIDFFMTFANRIRVPTMHVGLPSAVRLYPNNLHSKRRATDSGIRLLPPKMPNKEWSAYLRELLRYQWTDKLATKEDLEPVMREKSQRNPSLATSLFMLAQTMAIEKGLESLTSAFIRDVANRHFTIIRPLTEAIKSNNAEMIAVHSAAMKGIEDTVARANDMAKNRVKLEEMAKHRITHEAIANAATSLITLGKQQDEVMRKLKEFVKSKPNRDASWLVKQYLAWEANPGKAKDTRALEMELAAQMERDQAELNKGTE